MYYGSRSYGSSHYGGRTNRLVVTVVRIVKGITTLYNRGRTHILPTEGKGHYLNTLRRQHILSGKEKEHILKANLNKIDA